ncbi:MAG: zinc ribbon domain-containing protein [Thermoplasmata archaeon]
MPLASKLTGLLEPRWRPFIYVTAATALSALALLAIPLLGVLAATFFMFAFPYWMGERRPKVLALAGAFVILLTGILLAAFLTWDLYQTPAPLQRSEDGILTGGTVDPVFGDAETTFTFRVTYTNTAPPKEPPRVNITSTFFSAGTTMNHSMVRLVPSDDSYDDGVAYVFSTRLPSKTHYFHFVVLLANDTWVVTSDALSPAANSRGPVNISPLAFFGGVAASLIPFLYLTVGIPLFLVITAYWWFGQAKKKRQRFVGRRKCPNCGEPWSLDDEACPSCGFRV